MRIVSMRIRMLQSDQHLNKILVKCSSTLRMRMPACPLESCPAAVVWIAENLLRGIYSF
jgi:hypothetical protein